MLSQVLKQAAQDGITARCKALMENARQFLPTVSMNGLATIAQKVRSEADRQSFLSYPFVFAGVHEQNLGGEVFDSQAVFFLHNMKGAVNTGDTVFYFDLETCTAIRDHLSEALPEIATEKKAIIAFNLESFNIAIELLRMERGVHSSLREHREFKDVLALALDRFR